MNAFRVDTRSNSSWGISTAWGCCCFIQTPNIWLFNEKNQLIQYWRMCLELCFGFQWKTWPYESVFMNPNYDWLTFIYRSGMILFTTNLKIFFETSSNWIHPLILESTPPHYKIWVVVVNIWHNKEDLRSPASLTWGYPCWYLNSATKFWVQYPKCKSW